jgi:hypothetical protein
MLQEVAGGFYCHIPSVFTWAIKSFMEIPFVVAEIIAL